MKQFVLSVPTNYQYNSQSDVWLEAGGVSLGPINVDAAMALPGPEFHPMQDRFLKLHDENTHRLWFLWSKEELAQDSLAQSKCGCVGGCAFFGSNRNGPSVFHPSDRDFTESINTAVFYVCPDDSAFCFGQSLLQKGQLIFNANSGLSAFPMTPRKSRGLVKNQAGLCESKISMDTIRTSTLGDTSSPPTSLDRTGETIKANESYLSETTLVAEVGCVVPLGSQRQPPPIPKRERIPSSSPVVSQRSSLLSDTVLSDSIPSEYIPSSSIPDAYDTDRYVSTPSDVASWPSGGASGSASSLPDIVSPLREKSHQRKFSDPPFNRQQHGSSTDPSTSITGGDSMPSSLSSESRLSSKNSIPGHSRQSSLTSPVLRRLSSQLSFQREGSTTSMTGSGSERFFSAVEDFSGSAQAINSDISSPFGSLHRPRLTKQTRVSIEASDVSSQRSQSYSPENVSLSSSYYGDVDSPRNSMYTHRENTESEGSSSTSDSATSFVSALSSQRASRHSVHHVPSGSSSPTINADEPGDDLDLDPEANFDMDGDLPAASNYVNLHGQINQPITKSVLLTNCYMNHMTQLHCSHWSAPPPLPGHMLQWKGPKDGNVRLEPKEAQTPGSIVTGDMQTPTWIPHYSYLNQGFTPALMVNKKEIKSPPSISSPSSISDHARNERIFFPSDEKLDNTGKHYDIS